MADPKPPPDLITTLIERALGGDRRAEHELTESVLIPLLDAAVTKHLLGAAGRRFEKADVIHDVFQHLYADRWARLRPYDPQKGPLAAYVWTVTGNWIRDHARKRPPPQPTEEPEKDLAPDSGPDGKVELGQILDRIEQELSEEDLALFQWLYLEGASRATAAARLSITLEALHKRVQRLEARIRAIVSNPAQKTPNTRGGTP